MTGPTYPIKCRIRAEADVTVITVLDDIGPGGWFSDGLTAKDFSAQLAEVTGPLQVSISSSGGDVFDGIAIANAIRNYKGGPKTTVNDGIAASIASVIFQAGDERVIQNGAMVMIHDAFGMVVGNAAEARKFADTLDQVSDNIAGIYASRAGGTTEQWRDAMKEETWYTADEAVAAGLADRVGTGAAQLPAGMDLAAFSAVPGRIAAALRKLPQAKAPAADGGGSEGVLYGTGGGGGGGSATLTVTAGSPAVSYVVAGGSGNVGTGTVTAAADGGQGHSHDGAQDRAPKVKGKKAAKKARLRGEAPGACCPACGPDCACGGQPAARGPRTAAARTRVLGIESMPITAKALPVHHTATTGKPWDGPAAVAAMPADDTVLKYCHAWQDPAAAAAPHREGDDDADDRKGNYKFPHHAKKGGPANLAACRNGLARLSSADIPPGDDAGVKAHLQAHLDDGGGGEDAGNHAQPDLAGIDLEQIRAALKGALA